MKALGRLFLACCLVAAQGRILRVRNANAEYLVEGLAALQTPIFEAPVELHDGSQATNVDGSPGSIEEKDIGGAVEESVINSSAGAEATDVGPGNANASASLDADGADPIGSGTIAAGATAMVPTMTHIGSVTDVSPDTGNTTVGHATNGDAMTPGANESVSGGLEGADDLAPGADENVVEDTIGAEEWRAETEDGVMESMLTPSDPGVATGEEMYVGGFMPTLTTAADMTEALETGNKGLVLSETPLLNGDSISLNATAALQEAPADSSKSKAGVIVGSVIGGVAGLALIAVGAAYLLNRTPASTPLLGDPFTSGANANPAYVSAGTEHANPLYNQGP